MDFSSLYVYFNLALFNLVFFAQSMRGDDYALLKKLNRSTDSFLIQPCFFYNKDGGDLITMDFAKGGAAVELAWEYATDNIIPENVVIDTRYFNLGHNCFEKDTSVHHAMQVWLAGEQCDVFFGPGRWLFPPWNITVPYHSPIP